jgi:hypothetical protein
VNNTGNGWITGRFANYAEGATFRLNNAYDFSVSYVGGSGNDIVLASLNGRNPTTTTLTSSQNPSGPGVAVTFTAAVHANGTPSGEVWFRDGTVIIGTAPVNAGAASLTVSDLVVGTHAITAQYRGDAANGGSTSPVLTQSVVAEGSTPENHDGDPPVVVELTPTVNGLQTTVDLAFDHVDIGGTTTVTVPPTAPAPPPTGYQFGNPPLYMDISTSATVSGLVTLCIGWTEGQFVDESSVSLWHFEGGLWQDITTTLDTTSNVVCGRTSSFSPFALMARKFAFSGFLAPVSNAGLNAVKAGSAVPLKFSLGGNYGLSVFQAGYPKVTQIKCDTSAPTSTLDSTVTAGGSSLSYDTSSGQYTYVWKTDKAWAKTCRSLQMVFTDGTVAPSAKFDFR